MQYVVLKGLKYFYPQEGIWYYIAKTFKRRKIKTDFFTKWGCSLLGNIFKTVLIGFVLHLMFAIYIPIHFIVKSTHFHF